MSYSIRSPFLLLVVFLAACAPVPDDPPPTQNALDPVLTHTPPATVALSPAAVRGVPSLDPTTRLPDDLPLLVRNAGDSLHADPTRNPALTTTRACRSSCDCPVGTSCDDNNRCTTPPQFSPSPPNAVLRNLCYADCQCRTGRCDLQHGCLCANGGVVCDGRCVDLASDAANCGGCGNACATGSRCERGACARPSVCRSACECGYAQNCIDGRCVNAIDFSPPQPRPCFADCQCVPTHHCVGNGHVGTRPGTLPGNCEPRECPSFNQIRCGGVCVDLASDPRNCGDCGNACYGGQVCARGACVCPRGTALCGGACVDTLTDARNCGRCGNFCPSGFACAGGGCVDARACAAGLTRCGGVCVDLQRDPDHCGACNVGCADVCLRGRCISYNR